MPNNMSPSNVVLSFLPLQTVYQEQERNLDPQTQRIQAYELCLNNDTQKTI